MMNSMSWVRITGNNRLCHAQAGIVTDEAMMVMEQSPQGRGDWPHFWGDRSNVTRQQRHPCGPFWQKGLRTQT